MNVTPVKFMANTSKVTEMLFFRLKTWYWNLLVVLVIVAGVKDDMRDRRVPCIIHVPEKVYDYSCNDSFDRWIGSADVHKYYFGDQMEPERMV